MKRLGLVLILWVVACGGARGQEPRAVTLLDFDRGGKGFSFAQGVPLTPEKPTEFQAEIDLFFDLPDGVTMNNAALNRIFQGQAGIIGMGARPLKEITQAPLRGYKVGLKAAELRVGHSYCVRTADGKCFAKLHITNLDINEETLEFTYVYQPKETHKFDERK